MTQPSSETGALPLFNHTTRKDWGVAVLVREEGGKRGYLFEDGEERTMANGYHQLMRRVEEPSVDQRAFYERQRVLLARREKARTSTSQTGEPSFLDQLEKLHETHSGGLTDPKWLVEVRGEGAPQRAPRHRDALTREAQEQLSASALDALIKSQSFTQLWDLALSFLSHTDLVPAAQLKKPKSAKSDTLKNLALALRELLHGKGAYEPRFDAFLAALISVYGEAPHWEIATALSAAVHPADHVCVHPAAFRQQLKAMGGRGTALTRATSAGYTRFLSIARLVSNKLIEQGQTPRDLFDVYDFIRLTLGPATKVRVTKPKARAKSKAAPEAESESESESDSED